ncbi:MAG: META domain-containing protein [Bacteroidetes bacterium]|nr:META domain-containing protein [Bacteroidota bacterium]
MRKMLFFIAILCALNSCNSSKQSTQNNLAALQGSWQLNYITGPRIAFDGLYADKKPIITFDIKKSSISGNTSCNNFSGTITTAGNKISFPEAMAMTKMACPGEGELLFLQALKKINQYDVTAGYTLTLLRDSVAIMRFTKI